MRNSKKKFGKRGRKTGLIRKTPPLDRQTEPAVAWCDRCLGEIYEGEDYYRIEGRTICVDCLPGLVEEWFRANRITGGIS